MYILQCAECTVRHICLCVYVCVKGRVCIYCSVLSALSGIFVCVCMYVLKVGCVYTAVCPLHPEGQVCLCEVAPVVGKLQSNCWFSSLRSCCRGTREGVFFKLRQACEH